MRYHMKLTIRIATVFLMMALAGNVKSQTASGNQYVEIKTSAICGSCKATIEKAVYELDGIKYASLDLGTNVVAIKYSGDKTSAEKIKQAIISAGYDADEQHADKDAYDHLEACCKKE